MIIDLILDRKDGKEYSPREFYNGVMGYGVVGHSIAGALDDGEEIDVKRELSRYILDNDYNPDIINYIQSVNWL